MLPSEAARACSNAATADGEGEPLAGEPTFVRAVLINSVCVPIPGGLDIWACTVRRAGSQDFGVQRFSPGPNQVAGFSHCHRAQPESAAPDAAAQGCNLQRHRSRHADRA